MDNETLIKVAAGFAVVVAALIAAILGLYTQIKLKQYELRAQARKDGAAQRLGLYIPLLRFCYELDGRIGRILAKLHLDWLRASHLERIRKNEGFAKDPREIGYFIMSSIYLLACFFGWTEAIQRGVDETKAFSERSKFRRLLSRIGRRLRGLVRRDDESHIYFFDKDINIVRRLFQNQELFEKYSVSRKLSNPRDACKLHRHLQHSIGEMMLQLDGDVLRCKTFREFLEAYRDEQFRYWFVLLEELFTDLSDFEPNKDIETQAEMKNDIRPLRLLAIRYWCRVLMKNMSTDLGIETPRPDEVLQGLSDQLKTTITAVSLEKLELFLAGMPQTR